MTETHNGYTNYETWHTAMMIDQDPGEIEYWRQKIADLEQDYTPEGEVLNREEWVTYRLASALKDHYEEIMYDIIEKGISNCMFTALLTAGFQEIDWTDIAKTMKGAYVESLNPRKGLSWDDDDKDDED